MRFSDASHVDLRPFWGRRPCLGRCYGRCGLVGVFVAWYAGMTSLDTAWITLGLLCAIWLAAWYQAVGMLWRLPLVAAILVASLQVAWLSGRLSVGEVVP